MAAIIVYSNLTENMLKPVFTLCVCVFSGGLISGHFKANVATKEFWSFCGQKMAKIDRFRLYLWPKLIFSYDLESF